MFDKLHREWCEQVVCYFGKNGVSANINNRAAKMYGRAAKLVGVYLKCMVVIGPSAKTQLAHVAHPPIDSNLLKELAKVPGISPKAKKTFSDTRWTDLDFDGYDNLIETIRAEEKLQEDIDPFWRLERYWPKL